MANWPSRQNVFVLNYGRKYMLLNLNCQGIFAKKQRFIKSEKMGKVKTGKFDAFSKNETYASMHGIFPLTGREGQGYNAKDGKDAVA